MARIRTIKPEFWAHEDLSALPEATHMLAAALLNYADDEGYFNANPGLVRAACSPLREPSVPIPVSLQELSNVGYLRFGTGADGKRYGHVVTFEEHQTISKKKTSKIKKVGIVWDEDGNSPGPVPDTSRGEQGTGNREQGTPPSGDAGASPGNGVDLKKQVFDLGVGWLGDHAGLNERQARTLLGKWCREHGDGATLEALNFAARDSPVDPVPWIEHRLAGKRPKYAHEGPKTQTGLSPQTERMLREIGDERVDFQEGSGHPSRDGATGSLGLPPPAAAKPRGR